MKKLITKIVFIVIVNVLLVNCQKNKKEKIMDEKYGWSASVNGAERYAIEVHEGYLATKKEFITGLPNNGTEGSGWNNDGSGGNAGGDTIPTLVSITWLSYAEKTFWKLDEGALHADLILSYFKKGYDNYAQPYTGKLVHETYNHITVAVAPGGEVGVFLTGDWHRVQVGRFKAHKIDITPNQFYDNVDKDNQQQFYDAFFGFLTDETQADIKKNGIPLGLWNQYDERYNYRIVPQFYKDDFFSALHNSYFNGEEEYVYKDELSKKIYYNKALPKIAYLIFSKYNFSATFDWEELHEAFLTLAKNDKNANIDIVAKIGFEYNTVTFSAKCGDKVIPLLKTKGETHSNE